MQQPILLGVASSSSTTTTTTTTSTTTTTTTQPCNSSSQQPSANIFSLLLSHLSCSLFAVDLVSTHTTSSNQRGGSSSPSLHHLSPSTTTKNYYYVIKKDQRELPAALFSFLLVEVKREGDVLHYRFMLEGGREGRKRPPTSSPSFFKSETDVMRWLLCNFGVRFCVGLDTNWGEEERTEGGRGGGERQKNHKLKQQ